MKKYTLKTKSGERIAYTNACDLYEAQELFSKIKVLDLNDLLQIFIVEPVSF